jgi:hypothetical protein
MVFVVRVGGHWWFVVVGFIFLSAAGGEADFV